VGNGPEPVGPDGTEMLLVDPRLLMTEVRLPVPSGEYEMV